MREESSRPATLLAENIGGLVEVVASRFPDHDIKGVSLTRYESLGEIHASFVLKKEDK